MVCDEMATMSKWRIGACEKHHQWELDLREWCESADIALMSMAVFHDGNNVFDVGCSTS